MNFTPAPTSKKEFYTVSGTVVDQDTGLPLVGATVSVGRFSGLTDTNGNYRIQNISSKAYALLISMEGYQNHLKDLTVNKNLTVNVGLTPLIPGLATITGTVTDEKTGLPLADVTIRANGHQIKTGPDGSYSLETNLGTYTLNVALTGYETTNVTVNALEEKVYSVDVSVTSTSPPVPPPITPIILTANPSSLPEDGTTVIRALVDLEDGTPAVDVKVHFESFGQKGTFDQTPAEVITDTEGEAVITWTNTPPNTMSESLVVEASATVEGKPVEASLTIGVTLVCDRCH